MLYGILICNIVDYFLFIILLFLLLLLLNNVLLCLLNHTPDFGELEEKVICDTYCGHYLYNQLPSTRSARYFPPNLIHHIKCHI